MPSNSKEIRRRIKSTQSIAKITKAMELVSAAKMRKAQTAAQASRPYATLSAELLRNVAARTGQLDHPLIARVIDGKKTDKFRALAIVITSDKGLAGSLNTNVIGKTNELVKMVKADWNGETDFVTIGRKAEEAIRRMKGNIVASFSGKDKAITAADSKPIADISTDDFLAGKYQKIFIVYPQFVSTLVQKPNILQLLPFTEGAGDRVQGAEEFIFEPDPEQVLENLVARVVEFAVFQTLAESAASEHSARMVAMRNANEAAGDLIDDLSLSYNQARQAGITRELSEISAAKLAMEG